MSLRAPSRPLLLVALLAAAGCSREAVKDGPPAQGAPVLLVTIDTIRADHLSLYGYERATTPFLERLAASSIVFDRAVAQSSWTLPSMLSLFSSLEPPALGVHDGVRPARRRARRPSAADDAVEIEVFSDRHDTLTEVLREAGYATAGVSTNGHLISRQGFAQGFDRFDESGCMWGDAACALDRGLEMLRQGPASRQFLWVHLFDPHFDRAGAPPVYEPPASHRDLFAAEADDPQALTVLDYDRKLRSLDDRLGAFFDELERTGALDRWLVVLTGDHGEEFAEKGRWGHSKAVTNTLIEVPLLIRLPGGRFGGRRVAQPVRLLDVAPTVLDLVGVPTPATFQGTSLAPALDGGRARVPAAYGETRRSGRSLHYWIDVDADRKLVLDRADGSRRLYAYSTDRHEEHDLSAAEGETAALLESRLIALLETLDLEPGAVPDDLDAAARERLRALGYL